MDIEYLGNTGFLVGLQSGETIALDWWFSTNAFHGAWALYPPISPDYRRHLLSENPPDYVFISHLHADHLDPEVLKELDKETPVIIGKRAQPHLSRCLKGLGMRNIVEVPFEEEQSIGSFSVVLFDDFSTDSDAPTDEVGYQLDSAILIRDRDGVSFLNLNDDIPTRRQTEGIASRYGQPDAAAMVCSSASSYPQCMLNYDDAQKAEKRRELIRKTTLRFYDAMAGLEPRIAIPCGGCTLNGALAPLAEFAQILPDEAVMQEQRHRLPTGTELLSMESRDRLELRDGTRSLARGNGTPVSYREAAAEAAARQLDHERICIPESFRILLPNMLRRARQNLWRRQESLDLFPDWLVTLRVEPLGSVQPGDTLGPVELSYTFDLAAPEAPAEADENRQHIEFVVDARLLFMVLVSGTVWDNVYTASLIQTRRHPDVFDPNVTKLMSFFAV
ncbi:MBL fold metallo-hydrolase [Pelagibius sp.]|uniref:MBL fold metallo-hydrolase n=1 Tax=Pelagibius sp. TaxID=1931238 RepID=UPI0026078396|nr:MBL fold metallo-hydrolase [Pelagibius sp.]